MDHELSSARLTIVSKIQIKKMINEIEAEAFWKSHLRKVDEMLSRNEFENASAYIDTFWLELI